MRRILDWVYDYPRRRAERHYAARRRQARTINTIRRDPSPRARRDAS